jgi:hypothetical protein
LPGRELLSRIRSCSHCIFLFSRPIACTFLLALWFSRICTCPPPSLMTDILARMHTDQTPHATVTAASAAIVFVFACILHVASKAPTHSLAAPKHYTIALALTGRRESERTWRRENLIIYRASRWIKIIGAVWEGMRDTFTDACSGCRLFHLYSLRCRNVQQCNRYVCSARY